MTDYYYQDYTVQTANGEAFSPVLYNYDNVNFNPYLAQQMGYDEWKNNNGEKEEESESASSEGSVDKKKVKKGKKANKFRAKSVMKDYTNGLIWHLCADLVTLALLIVPILLDPLIYIATAIWILVRLCIVCCYDTMPWLLNNILNDKGANEYVDMIRQKRPKPRYGIECYHYEHYTDSKGNRKRRKVTTYTGYRQFNYQYWADWSPEIYKALKKYKLSAIVVNKKLVFFDKKTEKHYNKMYGKFISKNKNRDRHYNAYENLHIDSFQQYTLACRKTKDLPFYFNACVFWISACTMLAWFYYLFWSQVASIDYKLIKVISNKEKIQMNGDDGGEGALSSCTASDSTANDIGLGFKANDTDQDMGGGEGGSDSGSDKKKKKKKSSDSDQKKKKKKKSSS